MKYLLASLALAAGCSSGPQYGAPHQPSATEMVAVNSVQGSVTSLGTSQKSTMLDATTGESLFNMPLALGATIVGSVHTNQALHTQTDFSTCATVAPGSVSYNSCSYSAGGYSESLNGSITWSSNNINCDIHAKVSGAGSGASISGGFDSTGNLAWTSSSLDGSWHFDENFSVSAGFQSASSNLSVDVNYEKITWDGTGCVNSGTIEVIVKSNQNNGSGAIKATWTACNALTVQTATVVK